MEDGFGLLVVMVVDYATVLVSYKERREAYYNVVI